MPLFKVVLEIEIDAETPLQAACTLNELMDYHKFDSEASGWQFYVQEENSNEVFSVDLEEEEGSEVLPVTNYISLIQQK
jgi:hypothetical protein